MQRYAQLKELMPILESSDFAESQTLIEPFPAKAKTWILLGKKATIAAIGLASLLILLLIAVSAKYLALEVKLKTGGITNKNMVAQAVSFQQKFIASDIQRHLAGAQFATVLAPAIQNCAQWHIKVENNIVTVDYTLTESIGSSTTTDGIDKAMTQLGYAIQSQDKEVELLRHIITYVSK
jgi:hypothetical protein